MKTIHFFCLILLFLFLSCSSDDSNKEQQATDNDIYFPPVNSDRWEKDTVDPEDLHYVSDAGTRWAYHNVYKKM